MIKIENHCVDCGLPCLGSSCPFRHVSVLYCDWCGEEIDGEKYYNINSQEVCESCYNEYVKENEKDILSEFEDQIAEYLGAEKEFLK